MSHAATNWAIQQRGLKPTTKIVLWHLCDRFNPDFGCFPSQEQLAEGNPAGAARTLRSAMDAADGPAEDRLRCPPGAALLADHVLCVR